MRRQKAARWLGLPWLFTFSAAGTLYWATVPQALPASTTDTQYTSRRKIEENGWDQKTLLTRV